jgi:hypothetical protein
LPANAVGQATKMLNDKSRSLASQLLQGVISDR